MLHKESVRPPEQVYLVIKIYFSDPDLLNEINYNKYKQHFKTIDGLTGEGPLISSLF